jgi:hypothetical protein
MYMAQAVRENGGKLTLDKNEPPSGSCINFIKTASPFLPEGMVPRTFSGTRLWRLYAKLSLAR